MLDKFFTPLIIAGLLAGSVALVYKVGKLNGVAEVTREWVADNALRDAAMNQLRGEYDVLQANHKQRVGALTLELQTSQSEYEAALLRDRATHAERLQLATSRSDVYQRQARGSAVEQERLARHAAELDRTLEEGRGLVREFRETLRQRDITIKALTGIIAADRTLLSENQ